jgi:hypothetical protein
MRLIFALLLITASGCQLCGSGGACPPAGDCQPCQADCNACPGECNSCNSWCCSHGWFCFGRHAKYCRCWDNFLTTEEARCLAKSDLRKFDDGQCLSCDYRLGFEQAYVDVARGGSGQVPALPPAQFWKVCARDPKGHARAQQWFAGYAAGAPRAVALYEPFNKVASSGAAGYVGNGFPPVCNTNYAAPLAPYFGP